METVCPPGILRQICLERKMMILNLRNQDHPPPPPTQDVPPLTEPLPPVEAPAPPTGGENPVIYVPGTWSRGDDTNIYGPSYVIGPPVVDNGLINVDDLMSTTHTGPLPIGWN